MDNRLDPEQVQALAPAALRGFWSIADHWSLSDPEQMALLGLQSPSTLRDWQSGNIRQVDSPALERISYVFGIYKAINTLLPIPERADAWMRKPNDAPFLGGQSALEFMLSGKIGDLRAVRRYLDGELER